MSLMISQANVKLGDNLVDSIREVAGRRIHRSRPLSREDEAALAEMFDAERGLEQSRTDRSKRARRLSEGAPRVLLKRITE